MIIKSWSREYVFMKYLKRNVLHRILKTEECRFDFIFFKTLNSFSKFPGNEQLTDLCLTYSCDGVDFVEMDCFIIRELLLPHILI